MQWRSCAIDGPGGSGKSTLARSLAIQYSAKIISMDSFLLPPSRQRASAIARNYDLFRLYAEVIEPLAFHQPISYRVMDVATGQFEPQRRVIGAHERVILDGIYSHELAFRDAFDYTIYVGIPHEERMRRAVRLVGDLNGPTWLDKWLPGEDTYLASQTPMSSADLVLDDSKPFPSPNSIMDQLDRRLEVVAS